MNKTILIWLLVASGLAITALVAHSQHGAGEASGPHVGFGHDAGDMQAVTFSMRQNDEPLCGQPLYDGFYALTVEVFAAGAEQVDLADYERRVFAQMRGFEGFTAEHAERWVDHVQDIPRQMLEIIRQDPAVLDSCSNFSVALVGPP